MARWANRSQGGPRAEASGISFRYMKPWFIIRSRRASLIEAPVTKALAGVQQSGTRTQWQRRLAEPIAGAGRSRMGCSSY
jgi:hypothetical protein